MIPQISNAISSGQNAANIANNYTTLPSVPNIASSSLDAINQCFDIDVGKKLREFIERNMPTIKKQHSFSIDPNTKLGKFLAAIKKLYNSIMGIVSDIKQILAIIMNKIGQIINWINEKIQYIKNSLNTPCVRLATNALNVSQSLPTVPVIV